jgi:hypothetical protein
LRNAGEITAFDAVGIQVKQQELCLRPHSLISRPDGQVRETQEGFCVIRICVWWTTIAISAVAAWFEWQYRRNRRRQPEEQPEAKPPVGEKTTLPDEQHLLSGSD